MLNILFCSRHRREKTFRLLLGGFSYLSRENILVIDQIIGRSLLTHTLTHTPREMYGNNGWNRAAKEVLPHRKGMERPQNVPLDG